MDYTILGRTGLNVSVMGLGGGGPSQVGMRTGKTEAEAIAIIRQALDAGINFIDTAEAYNTEEIVGRAIKDVKRDSVVLSTKKTTWKNIAAADVPKSLEASLKRLGTDYIDIYHLHAVPLKKYNHFLSEIVPVLQTLREKGKIRFIFIQVLLQSSDERMSLLRDLILDFFEV